MSEPSFCVVKFLCVLINQITDCVTGRNVFNNWMLSPFRLSVQLRTFLKFPPICLHKAKVTRLLIRPARGREKSNQVGQKKSVSDPVFRGREPQPTAQASQRSLARKVASADKLILGVGDRGVLGSWGSPTNLVIYYNRGRFFYLVKVNIEIV